MCPRIDYLTSFKPLPSRLCRTLPRPGAVELRIWPAHTAYLFCARIFRIFARWLTVKK
jgi:hypothetical protein